MEALVRLPALQQVGLNQHSPGEAKIALFRSLFHGREDVYPRRFERARLAGAAIHRCVVMNGSGASAKSQGSNVPNVPASVFFP